MKTCDVSLSPAGGAGGLGGSSPLIEAVIRSTSRRNKRTIRRLLAREQVQREENLVKFAHMGPTTARGSDDGGQGRPAGNRRATDSPDALHTTRLNIRLAQPDESARLRLVPTRGSAWSASS